MSEQEEPTTKETVEDMVKQIQDAAYARGFEKAQSLAPFADRPNSIYQQDAEVLDYESEARAKVTELRMSGIRGNLSRHKDVLAIKARHNR